MAPAHVLDLVPPQFSAGDIHKFLSSGRTVSNTLSPLQNAIAIFLTNVDDKHVRSGSEHGSQSVYLAGMHKAPASERRLFVTDTSIIFAAIQNIRKMAPAGGLDWAEEDQIRGAVRKLTIDYVNFIKECWAHTSQPIEHQEGPLQYSSDHYRTLYTCFSLFLTLYLPEDASDESPIGEDLMEWLNTHFIEPSTEEGDHLSSLERPWEDSTFWPYLTRTMLRGLTKASIFFLDTLSQHPSENLQYVAGRLVPLLEGRPRLQQFSSEREFAHALRRWSDKVRTLRVEMDSIPESERQDDFENWWDRVSDLVGILEGRGSVLTRVCADLGADWKEVCAAWGIFIEPRLQRQALPNIAAQIMEELPPDPTDMEDMFHSAIFSFQVEQALEFAARIDLWLAAHAADLVQLIGLVSSDVDEDSQLSLRDHYIITYANYLHSDPGFWRITVDYLYSCGNIGVSMADEILLHVPLRLQNKSTIAGTTIEAEELEGVLGEVNKTCFDYQREAVRREVCKIAARMSVDNKEYGLAVSYSTSAEDWSGLGRIVDAVLDEYISNGPAVYVKYISEIVPSLDVLKAQAGSQGIFIHRLMFAIRYADFHRRLMQEDRQEAAQELVTLLRDEIAPKSWWGLLLCDAIPLLEPSVNLLFTTAGARELLRRLEEVFMAASQGAGEDYLAILSRSIRSARQIDALDRLRSVRLALARYFAAL